MSDTNCTTPDWELFGRAIMVAIMVMWPEACDIDCYDIQQLAAMCGLLRKEQYDPEVHGYEGAAEYDVQPGDDWFVRNYAHRSCADD